MEYNELNLLLIPVTNDIGQNLPKILGSVEISFSVVLYNQVEAVQEITKIRPLNYKEILNSGTLSSQKFESDDNGYAVIDLSEMLSSKNFLKLINSYEGKYSFIINTKIIVPKTEKYYPYNDIVNNPFDYSFTKDLSSVEFNTILFEPVTLESLEVKYSISDLKTQLKRIEDTYLIAKSNIEQKITLSDKEIEIVTQDYEPVNFNYVVTRMLEFKEGTLNAGMTFCEQFGLRRELEILKTIDRQISRMSEIYPKLTLDDGEGIPYSGPTEVAQEKRTL
jgi:hypothetical protein